MLRTRRLRLAAAAVALGAGLLAAPPGRAASFSDDFEAAAAGALPPGWGDVRGVALPHEPLPSAVVVDTQDAFGQATRALQTVDAAATSRGAFAPIAPAPGHQLSADLRVDAFGSSGPGATATSDWPILFGVAELLFGSDLCCFPTPQVGLYVSTLTGGFRLYAIDGAGQATDVDLGAGAALDTWYHVDLAIDAATGTVHSRISDVLGGTPLVDRQDTLPDWAPADFDVLAFFSGQLSGGASAGRGTIDDVAYAAVPEPGTWALLGLGLLGAGAAARRR